MPVYSMTGYASAVAGAQSATETTGASEAAGTRTGASSTASVTVELRSVNGRFLDLGFRLPDEFRSLEPALRELLDSYHEPWRDLLSLDDLSELMRAAVVTQPVNRSLTWWECLAEATEEEWREWGEAPVRHLANVLEPWPL